MATALHQKTRSPFGNLLREALEETGVSAKELSRRIAPEPHQAEAKRRLIQKYVRGEVSPGATVRNEIADALGVDRARFTQDREREARRMQILNALIPLTDVLLELAEQARDRAAA